MKTRTLVARQIEPYTIGPRFSLSYLTGKGWVLTRHGLRTIRLRSWPRLTGLLVDRSGQIQTDRLDALCRELIADARHEKNPSPHLASWQEDHGEACALAMELSQ